MKTIIKMCTSKIIYQSKKDALEEIDYWKEYNAQEAYRVKPYKCKFCSKWHIGGVK